MKKIIQKFEEIRDAMRIRSQGFIQHVKNLIAKKNIKNIDPDKTADVDISGLNSEIKIHPSLQKLKNYTNKIHVYISNKLGPKTKSFIKDLSANIMKYTHIFWHKIKNIDWQRYWLKFEQYLPQDQKEFFRNLKKKLILLNWYEIHQEILNPKNRTKINKSFLFIIPTLMLIILAKMTGSFISGTMVKSPNPQKPIALDMSRELKIEDINLIRAAQILKTTAPTEQTGPISPKIAENVTCTESEKISSLPIKLLNTVVLQDSMKSIAAVAVNNGPSLIEVREGDKIQSMAKVDRIERLGIIVKNLKDGKCELIANTSTQQNYSPISVLSPTESKRFKSQMKKITGIQNEGNKFTIDKNFLKDKMKDLNTILTQARGVPIQNSDGTMSFKMVDVEPGGLFSHLGIQNDDVITQINGRKITNLNEVMNLFSRISTLEELNLMVVRGGEETPLEYKMK